MMDEREVFVSSTAELILIERFCFIANDVYENASAGNEGHGKK
jgi:hypothetical protein